MEQLKKKQQQEIEQLMEHELKMAAIRERNEEKMEKQQQKERERREEIEKKHREQEQIKAEMEQKKRLKEQEEEEEAKRKRAEDFKREQERIAKEREKEIERKVEAIRREEEQKRKQEEFQRKKREMLEKVQTEIEKKRAIMEVKQAERKQNMEKMREERRREAIASQEKHNRKIQEVMKNNEGIVEENKRAFEERQRKTEKKRKEFEERRKHSQEQHKREAEEKSQEIKRILAMNELKEEEKKKEYEQKMEKLQERKLEQLQRSMKESSMKQDEERLKNEKRKLILEKNYEMEEEKKEKLIAIQSEKSKRSEMAKYLNEKKLIEKKFREFVTGQDKQFNVQRISRQYQYRLDHLDERIQGDNMRAEKIKKERDEIMTTKNKLRRDIDKDKQAILQDFEQIKQGKVDPSIIAKKYGYVAKPPGEGDHHGMSQTGGMSQSKLRNSTGHSNQNLQNRPTRTAEPGFRATNKSQSPGSTQPVQKPQAPPQPTKLPEIKRENPAPAKVSEDNAAERAKIVEELKRRHNRELIEMIEAERRNEDIREANIANARNDKERTLLEAQYEVERAEAQTRIRKVMKKHRDEIDRTTGVHNTSGNRNMSSSKLV